MRPLLISLFTCLCIVLPFSAKTYAATFQNGDSIHITVPQEDDTFLSGNSVTLSAPVRGELFAAGSDIHITKSPDRSSFLVGRNINDTDGSGYNLFAVGQQIKLSGIYTHTVYLAGSTVTVDPGTVINGDLYIAAADTSLAGTVLGTVTIYSNTLALHSAHVGGSLHYTGQNSATGVSESTIGSYEYKQVEQNTNSNPTQWLIRFFAAILTAGILGLLIPNVSRSADLILQKRYWASFGIGWATLILIPILITVLFVTMIGYKIALILLSLYVVLCIVASTLTVLFVGHKVLLRVLPRWAEHPWLQAVLGTIILFGLGSISGLNLLLGIALFVPLVGACLLAAYPKSIAG